MIDKFIHNNPFEIFLMQGQGMVGLVVCANSERRWSLIKGVCILSSFKDETSMLIIDFRIRYGVHCLKSIHRADIFDIMLYLITLIRHIKINAFDMEVLGLLRVKKKRFFLGVTKWIKALI